MKASLITVLSAIAATEVAAHATFQQLWVNGVDQGSTCARLPQSNSPISSVTSTDIRCNANPNKAASKCAVTAGGTVTVEMHQQNGDRSCSNEAIGGAHYGPVQVYLSKVDDASSNVGDGGWFKIYSNAWAAAPGSSVGDSDYWGTKDMNACCGKLEMKVPTNIPSGDYLLRAEVLALHAASTSGGYQPYVTCYQITVSGGSGSVPSTVKFPGAYSASDPGIALSIHQKLTSYTPPGPAVISGGTVKTPGSGTCAAGGSTGGGNGGTNPVTTTTTRAATTTSAVRTTLTTTTRAATTTAAGNGGGNGATCAAYQQCGGSGWTGCSTCASGYKCSAQNSYYSQCIPS